MTLPLTRPQFELHEKMRGMASQHRRLEAQICACLREVDQTKLYKRLGFPSLFQYVTHELGFSAAVAYAFISVSRKSVAVPELKAAIEGRRLTVAKASRIAPALKAEIASSLIEFAQTHSCRETEREMARLNPKSATRDCVKPLAQGQNSLQATISDRVQKKLRRVESLMAQRRKATDFNSVLEAAFDAFLQAHDPVLKAEQAHTRKSKKARAHEQGSQTKEVRISDLSPVRQEAASPSSLPKSESIEPSIQPQSLRMFGVGLREGKIAHLPKRSPLTAEQKQTVFLRDQGRCTHINAKGQRCNSDRWVDVHHIKEVWRGGTNDPANLTVLCSFHHDLVHQLSFAFNQGEVNWLRSPRRNYV